MRLARQAGYQQAKGIDAVRNDHASVVVTVCDRARETCNRCLDAPLQLHWSIPDPVPSAQRALNPLDAFRTARDELRVRVEGLFTALPVLTSPEKPVN